MPAPASPGLVTSSNISAPPGVRASPCVAPPSGAFSLPMRVLLAHPGIQHALRLARELERTNLLGEFWTGLALAERGLAAGLVTGLRRMPRIKGLSNRIAR